MKVVWTDEANRDLADIINYVADNYPGLGAKIEARVRAATTTIAMWPQSAARSRRRREVGFVPLGKYPYRIFYESQPITPQMAVRIGKLTGTTAESWLAMQASCDLQVAKRELASAVAKIPTLAVDAA